MHPELRRFCLYMLAALVLQPIMLLANIAIVYPLLGGRTSIAMLENSMILLALGLVLAFFLRGRRPPLLLSQLAVGLVLAPFHVMFFWMVLAASK